MKKTYNTRVLILKGLTLHLKGKSLKKINTFYNQYFEKYPFKENDIAFVNYFTSVAIRNRGYLELVVGKYIRKTLPKKPTELKAALLLGISQILYSKVPEYASVNSTVDLFRGKIKKWRSLANAVLRRVSFEKNKIKLRDNNLACTIPSWLYNDWKNQFGVKDTNKILKIYKEEPSLDIRVKNKINYWVKCLKGKKVGQSTVRVSRKGRVENIEGFDKGHWWIQDIAAQLPVILMGNIKDKSILDLCASPGGKTAQMLNEGAFVKAVDISEKRVKILRQNIKRLGLTKNLSVVSKDIMLLKDSLKFDIVLLDAPCSGTGTFRKNPDVLWTKSKNDVIKNSQRQKKLIRKALELVKSEGKLIYSNCSLQYEEGEYLISELQKEKLIEIDIILDKEISGYPKEIINKGLIRTLPYMYNDGMDGFFIARLKKLEKYEKKQTKI